MTPADEATFIALWQEGASYRDLAQVLGCALGTMGSRAAALVAQGKIAPGLGAGRILGSRLRGGSPQPFRCRDRCRAVQSSRSRPPSRPG
jgi:hypothetical protein